MINFPEVNAKNIAMFVAFIIVLTIYNFNNALKVEGRVDKLEQSVASSKVDTESIKELIRELKKDNNYAHNDIKTTLADIQKELMKSK